MANFKYQLATPVTIIEVDNVTVSEFRVDFKSEDQTVEITWYAQNDNQLVRSIKTNATMAQFNTFLDNYDSYAGTTFEEKLLGLAAAVSDQIPGGGTVGAIE